MMKTMLMVIIIIIIIIMTMKLRTVDRQVVKIT
jgi:hypothetical protein